MTEIKLCKSCGAPLSPTANFCRECGTPVLKPDSVDESASTAAVETAVVETAVEPSTANELVNDGVALYEKGDYNLSLIHISEPTRRTPISYAVFCLKKKKYTH